MSRKNMDTSEPSVAIAGDNSGIVAGRDVIINQSPPPPQKVRAVVPVTEEHISNEQRSELQRLVREIVELETKVKRSPKSYSAVWGSLNARLKVSEYKLRARDDFPRAEKYLREWIGRLSNTKTAQRKDGDWRKRKLAFIHTNCKQLDLELKMREFIQRKFNSSSLTELSDTDLVSVYNAVARWKKEAKKSGA